MTNSELKIGPTLIEDTFAEAFSMRYTRLIVTAINDRWLKAAIAEFTGYGSSVIGCDAEVGVERWLSVDQTDDGRPGVSVMLFGFSTDALQKAVVNRVGQCLMTCPTTAVFDGFRSRRSAEFEKANASDSESPADGGWANEALENEAIADEVIALGKQLRFFGDGFQKSKLIDGRRFWRVPVMDGEFIVEDQIGVGKGVAGGNLLILGVDQTTTLVAAERAVDAIKRIPSVITPFPGGVVRSGSKVGSRYPKLRASTSHSYCPTLVGRVDTKLPPTAKSVYEIVIDGSSFETVAAATKAGVQAATGDGIIAVSAGNYGGKLGKHHFHLHALLGDEQPTGNHS